MNQQLMDVFTSVQMSHQRVTMKLGTISRVVLSPDLWTASDTDCTLWLLCHTLTNLFFDYSTYKVCLSLTRPNILNSVNCSGNGNSGDVIETDVKSIHIQIVIQIYHF